MKPRIAMTLGDPCGVGPELIATLLADPEVAEEADVVLVADRWLWARALADAGVALTLPEATTVEALPADHTGPVLLATETAAEAELTRGQASRAGGAAALAALETALELARRDRADAIMFAPLNKQALHLAGFGFEDELRWFAHALGHDGYVCELNVLDDLWTSRVTSHVPLRAVADQITEEGIVQAVALVDAELRRAGLSAPRIGVAALNPHAGDGGNFGTEEIDVIAPAVARAAQAGHRVEGPYPSDTVFVRATRGDLDAVVTMYHDQGQIAMKLLGFGRGVTVQGGLPVPVTTPAHGTAYDIAGQGVAKPDATRRAFEIAVRMGAARREARAAA